MGDDPPAKRIHLSETEVNNLSREEFAAIWKDQERYIDQLEALNCGSKDTNEEITGLRESEEKLKQQQLEATRRENVLVMRLTTKEQELQDYITQIQEIKQAQVPSSAQLRNMLLDPAVNLMFQRMKKEMDSSKEKLEQTQNELSAWKFTPDSQTGKRLMAKCRMLLQENEELGKVISSGRTAKLEGEIALEKKLVEELKNSQAETEEFLVEIDEDVEAMQSTIYLYQQQLKEAQEQIIKLQEENEQLRGGKMTEDIKPYDVVGKAKTEFEQMEDNMSRTSTPSYVSNTEMPMETEEYRTYTSLSPHEPETTNGEHQNAMESTDSDDTAAQMFGHRHTNLQQQTTGSNNHSNCPPVLLNDYPTESTDASSDAWSPTQVKHSDHSLEGEGFPISDKLPQHDANGKNSIRNGVENETVDYITDEET
ncbi:pre-mRNA-splicing regulator WTAP [Lingula anatina]|uniref:Pre-mRNA-splicing regulator WTAP n=1 Tax=Lingula anatina TaxID=7574 RepID=A0A1S3K209_LINAN|nr:pre-mRNA-splicing regulator WTAP [Lingula anatina]XP_013416556.1 pre-mRNA-splicing regulator WTAP [Lingula anatina]XP_013416557.1 pre-mRNA-splicing regulator WTAP [Lingula anatina]|eukprot:XP_013416555.1 pre-mRNA-splicing regulator WTAP [Lingula anatina]